MEMDKLPLISVIVPIYNVERFLVRCIDSIIGQSYCNVEILLIDDGSSDSSPEICDQYALKDARIKVVHKPNGGQASARNAGLNIMQGDYVSFIDSDDFMHKDFLKTLYHMCIDNNCEIAQCSYLRGDSNYFMDLSIQDDIEVFNTVEAFLSRKLRGGVVARVYKSFLFAEERFPEDKMFEDEALTYRVAYKAHKIAITENKLYYYYLNLSSVTHSQKWVQSTDFMIVFEDRLSFFKNKEKSLYLLTQEMFCLALLLFYAKCKNNPENTNNLTPIVSKFNELFADVFYYSNIPLKNRIVLLLFRLSPDLFALLLNKFKFLREG